MGIRTVKILLAVVCALGAGACSSGNGATGVPSLTGTTPSGSASNAPASGGEDAFTKCMKENGVDINTPDQEGGGKQEGTSAPADRGRYDAALEKCRKFMSEGGVNQRPNEEQLRQAVEFAKCMRGKGVNYPDPDPNQAAGNGVVKIPEGVDADDPAFRDKMKDCLRDTGELIPVSSR
jgi:hypothetical protein